MVNIPVLQTEGNSHQPQSELSFLPRILSFDSIDALKFCSLVNISKVSRKRDLYWTIGREAEMKFRLPKHSAQYFAIKFEVGSFVTPERLPEQIVSIFVRGGRKLAEWKLRDRRRIRKRAILVNDTDLSKSGEIVLDLRIPNCASPESLGMGADRRELGVSFRGLSWKPISSDDISTVRPLIQQYGRSVGTESRKSFDDKLDSGFWSQYITGPNILDIGFAGYRGGAVPIFEGAIGVDIDYPGYDGRILPFATDSQDTVYSSHCLEHIPDFVTAIREWYRVTKLGGHIIVVVPHAALYERKRTLPSQWHSGHLRFYTPQSLLLEFEKALAPNTYRIRHLIENDKDYDYDRTPDLPAVGCFEIELVVQKIKQPSWTLLE